MSLEPASITTSDSTCIHCSPVAEPAAFPRARARRGTSLGPISYVAMFECAPAVRRDTETMYQLYYMLQGCNCFLRQKMQKILLQVTTAGGPLSRKFNHAISTASCLWLAVESGESFTKWAETHHHSCRYHEYDLPIPKHRTLDTAGRVRRRVRPRCTPIFVSIGARQKWGEREDASAATARRPRHLRQPLPATGDYQQSSTCTHCVA